MNEPDLCRRNDGLFMCNPLRGPNAENTNASTRSDEYISWPLISHISMLLWAQLLLMEAFFFFFKEEEKYKMGCWLCHWTVCVGITKPHQWHVQPRGMKYRFSSPLLPEMPNTAVHTLSQNRGCFTPNRFPPSRRNNLHRHVRPLCEIS